MSEKTQNKKIFVSFDIIKITMDSEKTEDELRWLSKNWENRVGIEKNCIYSLLMLSGSIALIVLYYYGTRGIKKILYHINISAMLPDNISIYNFVRYKL